MIREFTLTGIVLGVISASSAMAQEQPVQNRQIKTDFNSGVSALEEIVVTANRREETVQNSSLAISVVGGESLAEAQVTQAKDLGSVVPGLSISGGPAAQTYLRGVGSFATDATAESAIAYNINGVYISRPTGIGPIFFDLERVEVLKGPQGTLYGRNASGGAINLITRRPTREFNFRGSVDVGDYGLRRATVVVGGGVGDLALRAAVQRTDRDGYLSDGYNDQDSIAGRLTGLWEPNDTVSLSFTGEYAHQEGMGSGQVKRSSLTAEPSDPWSGPSIGLAQQPPTAFIPGGTRFTDQGFQDVTPWAFSAQLDVDLGWATLTFLPAYRDVEVDYLTYNPGFHYEPQETSEQQSYELRLGNADERLKWTLGAYAFDEAQTQLYFLNALPVQQSRIETTIDTKSYALFGDANLTLTEGLRLIAGVRYSEDEKDQDGWSTIVLPAPAMVRNLGHLENDQVTWRAGLEKDVGPDNMLFATVSTGYKSGSFFPTVQAPDNQFAPEEITAYTVGSRNRFLDNQLQLNFEGFYWKYEDKQERYLGVTPSGTPQLLTTNAGEATLYGIAVDMVYKPTYLSTLSASVEYLNTNYDSFSYPIFNPSVSPAFLNSYPPEATGCELGPVVPFTANDFIPALRGDSTQVVDCSGNPLVRAPEWAGSVTYEQVFELSSNNEIVTSLNAQFASSQYLTPDFIESGRDDGYVAVNAHVTLVLGQQYSLSLWGRNLTEEEIYTGGFRYPFSRGVAQGGDPTLLYASIRDPRTFGATFKAEF